MLWHINEVSTTKAEKEKREGARDSLAEQQISENRRLITSKASDETHCCTFET